MLFSIRQTGHSLGGTKAVKFVTKPYRYLIIQHIRFFSVATRTFCARTASQGLVRPQRRVDEPLQTPEHRRTTLLPFHDNCRSSAVQAEKIPSGLFTA